VSGVRESGENRDGAYFGVRGVSRAFELSYSSADTVFSFIFDKEWAKKVPEIIHVDGSVCPQTIRKDTNPRFHCGLGVLVMGNYMVKKNR
ncbi:MAG: hypothetical protein JW808_01470, partial [Victivallales bacterium]|nr:hypothetical protein [Victivallales bacterium]